MRQTKRHQIRNRIFSLSDLKRIASVFDKEVKSATKSSHHFSVEYSLYFADDSSVEGDSSNVLEDSYSEIKRPVKVEFRFSDYDLDRKATFSVTHGDSKYGNEFVVSSKDITWLNDIYTKLLDLVNGTKPQSSWILKHSTLVYHLVAIGVGAFGMLVIDLVISFIMPSDISIGNDARDKVKAIAEFVSQFEVIFYILGWAWRWLAGWAWGAGSLTRWLLSSWPIIDLDFGAEHLKLEKQRRKRLYLFLPVIIVPIILSIMQDIIKGAI
jgi:hypothetical protein